MAENVILCILSEESKETSLASIVNELILGAWLSVLIIVRVIVSVDVLPSASLTVNVTTSFWDP